MEFKVSELEREPIDFEVEVAPGTVDLGQEAEQQKERMRDVEVLRGVVCDSEQEHGEEQGGAEQDSGLSLEGLQRAASEEHDVCPFLKDKLTLPKMRRDVKCACLC